MPGEPQLTVSGLEKRFGDEFRLSAVDLEVDDDEIVALLGPSGCGKTTTLRCIGGVETPDAGRITIADELVEGDGRSKPPEKRDVGMVYQNYAIWPHKTVYENVVFPLEHATHPFSRGSTKSASKRYSPWFRSTTSRSHRRLISAAVNNSERHSPGHWFTIRTCCCSTNR